MNNNERWLLPEGIEEVLPVEAQQLECLRRELLDLYHSWGYQLVMPPFIEYLETLLVGTGNDLDLQTFKLTDQLNGRLMGVRADIAPQVARIDAHRLREASPTRLCYMGTVLHTRPDGFAGSRSPLQIGAELYGHAGIESDVEILSLMVESLKRCGIEQSVVDLGHVGIFSELARQAELNDEQETELFNALQRKARPEIEQLLTQWQVDADSRQMLIALIELNGDEQVLDAADKALAKATPPVHEALRYLKDVARALHNRLPEVNLIYDLAELRGYHYHTGLVFAAFVANQGQAVAQGGRYDGIGEAFGNARPATGFSADLKTLHSLGRHGQPVPSGIFAPWDEDAALLAEVARLRANGERVVFALPGQSGDARTMACDRQLVQEGEHWLVKPV
jgi:ATP phosphoribosyltransferase regulatory subunit